MTFVKLTKFNRTIIVNLDKVEAMKWDEGMLVTELYFSNDSNNLTIKETMRVKETPYEIFAMARYSAFPQLKEEDFKKGE